MFIQAKCRIGCEQFMIASNFNISKMEIKPNPERYKPLRIIPFLTTTISFSRCRILYLLPLTNKFRINKYIRRLFVEFIYLFCVPLTLIGRSKQVYSLQWRLEENRSFIDSVC